MNYPPLYEGEWHHRRALMWAAENPWFGTNIEATEKVMKRHEWVVEKLGLPPDSDEYWAYFENMN